jgi:hypothetical protein
MEKVDIFCPFIHRFICLVTDAYYPQRPTINIGRKRSFTTKPTRLDPTEKLLATRSDWISAIKYDSLVT